MPHSTRIKDAAFIVELLAMDMHTSEDRRSILRAAFNVLTNMADEQRADEKAKAPTKQQLNVERAKKANETRQANEDRVVKIIKRDGKYSNARHSLDVAHMNAVERLERKGLVEFDRAQSGYVFSMKGNIQFIAAPHAETAPSID